MAKARKVSEAMAARTREAMKPNAPEFQTVPLSLLIPPRKPMRSAMDPDKLRELCDSIREVGLIHPICVFPVDGKLEVGAGHRRYEACKTIGAAMVDVKIYRDAESLRLSVMLHENVIREEVTAAEEGVTFLELANEHGWSMPQLCEFFHRPEQYINERVDLVTKFPDVGEQVANRQLTFAQAKAIMRCAEKGRRAYLIDQAVIGGVNARNLNVMVDDFKKQDRIAQNIGAPAAVSDVYSVAEITVPHCTLCSRDDDQANMTLVSVHRGHLRDLELLCEAYRGGAPAPGSGQ